MSGAAGNDECTLREQRQWLVPSLNVEKGIDADQEKQPDPKS